MVVIHWPVLAMLNFCCSIRYMACKGKYLTDDLFDYNGAGHLFGKLLLNRLTFDPMSR